MRRILVIDDEPLVRDSLARVLGSPEVSVVVAADAEAGLAVMRAEPVDLAIVDVVLPGMNGVAAIREIRRLYPAVRIIAISGGGGFGLESYRPEGIATGAYLAACTAAGAHATLAKPFETAELRALISRVQTAEAAPNV